MISFLDTILKQPKQSASATIKPVNPPVNKPSFIDNAINTVKSVGGGLIKQAQDKVYDFGLKNPQATSSILEAPKKVKSVATGAIKGLGTAIGNQSIDTNPVPFFKPKNIKFATIKDVAKVVAPDSAAEAFVSGQPEKILPNIKSTLTNSGKALELKTPEDISTVLMGTAGGGTSKFAKRQVELVKNSFSPEVRAKVGQFAEIVETASNANRKQIGEIGDYIQSLAETVFGKNQASKMSNKQLKNAFDLIMQQADETGGFGPKFNIGLGTANVRGGVKPKIGTTITSEGQKLLGPGDPEKRLQETLKTAIGKRTEQGKIYRAERSVKFEKLDEAYEAAGGGEAGLKAKMEALKGPLSKVDFDPVRNQVSDTDVKFFLDKIEGTPHLSRIEKVPAQKALIGILDGKLPTESEIDKLKQVFKPELVDALVENRTVMQKISANALDALNIPRTLMSSADLSAPLRQGAFAATAHPKDFARSFKNMFGYAFNQKKFDDFYEELAKRPTFKKMMDSGVAVTDMGTLSNREESFMSTLAEKIPVVGQIVKGSNRAYTGFLNNFRADLFDTIYKNGVKLGKADDEKFLKDLAGFVNTATGRGNFKSLGRVGDNLEAAAPLLNSMFFSPRLIASRLSLLNPAYYARLEPTVRKEAVKSLVTFVGTGLSILGAVKLAGGDNVDVGTDIRSADFGKIKIGDTRYDIWGGFQQYAVHLGRMFLNQSISSTTGKINVFGEGYKPTNRLEISGRFLRNKLGPIPSFGADYLTGKDSEGEDFSVGKAVLNRIIPLVYQDLGTAIEEYGPLGPLLSVPGLFGIGNQTYHAKPTKKKRPGIGTNIDKLSNTNLG